MYIVDVSKAKVKNGLFPLFYDAVIDGNIFLIFAENRFLLKRCHHQ